MEEGGHPAREETQKEAGEVWIPSDQILSISWDVRPDCVTIYAYNRTYQANSIEEIQDPKSGKKGYRFRPFFSTDSSISRNPSMEK